MNELLTAATRFFNAAAALIEATLEKEHGKKSDAATEAPKPRKPRAAATVETPPAAGADAATAPAAAAPTQEAPSGNAPSAAPKMTTEEARPRVLAVAQKIGSQAVKDLIKKETGADALAKVPAEKLPALVAAVEAAGKAAEEV